MSDWLLSGAARALPLGRQAIAIKSDVSHEAHVEAMFDEMISANLRSAFLVTRAFISEMVRRKSGDVFFMSSIAGRQAYPNGTGYCAAKFGVAGLAQVLRAELKAKGIRVCGKRHRKHGWSSKKFSRMGKNLRATGPSMARPATILRTKCRDCSSTPKAKLY